MPTSLPLASTMPRQPKLFCVMVTSAALIGSVLAGERQALALVHDVGDVLEAGAERSAGMEHLEVVRR